MMGLYQNGFDTFFYSLEPANLSISIELLWSVLVFYLNSAVISIQFLFLLVFFIFDLSGA